jgi:hypothetical protein
MSDTLNETGAAALASIRDMLAAVAVDYDRLEELRETDEPDEDEARELAELEEAAGDCADEDEARERIQEDPLSVQVRSGWYSPGEADQKPEEFELLLSTGGPAVRILGELDEYGEPSRAWLEVQDWGTPWTHYFEPGVDDMLLEYAGHFYFGE